MAIELHPRRIVALRRIVQTARVAHAVRPSLKFVADVIRRSPLESYVVRRSGRRVFLRPHRDPQVARELLSKNAYALPTPLANVLEGRETVRVLDVGANIGLFSLAVLDEYGPRARIVAVEPDPENLEVLRQNVAANDGDRQIEVLDVAVSTRPGVVRFDAGRAHASQVVDDGGDDTGRGVISVKAADFFSIAAGCDLVKLDVEGSEWPLLRDTRLASLDARALILEWHGGAGAGEDAKRLLEAAGFDVQLDELFVPGSGLLWAWRPRRSPPGVS